MSRQYYRNIKLGRIIYRMIGVVMFLFMQKPFCILLCLHFLYVTGCVKSMENEYKAGGTNDLTISKRLSNGGRISLFLNIADSDDHISSIILHSAEIHSTEGRWYSVSNKEAKVTGIINNRYQLFLGRSKIRKGYYDKIRLGIEFKSTERRDSKYEEVLTINPPLYVGRSESPSLFLQSKSRSDDLGKYQKHQTLTLLPKKKRLMTDIAYVACPEINTVYMICLDRKQICDSFGISGRPGYLANNSGEAGKDLYVLTGVNRQLNRVNIYLNKVENRFRIPGMATDLNFTVAQAGKKAFIIDRKRGTILRLDLNTGEIELKNRLGYQPSHIMYLANNGLLAVSMSMGQSVNFIDPETLNIVKSVATGSRPEGMDVNAQNNLFVAEALSSSVLVYDLTFGRVTKRIPVGFNPFRLKAVGNNVYVTSRGSNFLHIINSRQLDVVKTINLEGETLELAYSRNNKILLVGNTALKTVDIIDTTADKLVGRIPLGTQPHGLTVFH